jgi:antitoxin component YwqK of YwqJK toxin-antitoxin module
MHGLQDGLGIIYWMNGNKRGEGISNGGPVGKWVWYYESGGIEEAGNYKVSGSVGYRDGRWIYYIGSTTIIRNYKDGELNGKEVAKLGNNLWAEENYVDGKRNGESFGYYYDGQVAFKRNYKDGKVNGKWIIYYENGMIHEKRNSVDGKPDGKWVVYHENGDILDEDIWENGECVERCEGNEVLWNTYPSN